MLSTQEALLQIQQFKDNKDIVSMHELPSRMHIGITISQVMELLSLTDETIGMNIGAILTSCVQYNRTVSNSVNEILELAVSNGVVSTLELSHEIEQCVKDFISYYKIEQEKEGVEYTSKKKKAPVNKTVSTPNAKKDIEKKAPVTNVVKLDTDAMEEEKKRKKKEEHEKELERLKLIASMTHITSVYYANHNDDYIYLIGIRGDKEPLKVWPLPIIICKYQEGIETTYYKLIIKGIEKLWTNEELKRGTYTNGLDVENLATPSKYGAYANIITILAKDAPVYNMVDKTGLHSYTEGDTTKYGFMYPTGKMLTEEDTINTTFDFNSLLSEDDSKHAIHLWEEAYAKRNVSNQEIKAEYQFLKNVAKDNLALILQCHMARSLFFSVRSATFKAGYALMEYGDRGSGKTELSMFTRGLIYPYEYRGLKDGSNRDKATAMEVSIARYVSVPYVIDDFHLNEDGKPDKESKEAEKLIQSLIRSLSSYEDIKKRSNTKLTLQKGRKVLTLPTFISEYYPTELTQADFRRMLTINVTLDSINRTGEHDKYSLINGSKEHKFTQFAIGYRLVMHLLKNVNQHGIDGYADILEVEYKKYRSEIKKLLTAKWKIEQNTEISGIIDNLLEISGQIMIGASLLDTVSEGATTYVKDIKNSLVDIVYKHVVKLLKEEKSEEGYDAFSYGLKEVLIGIGNNKEYFIEGIKTKFIIENYYKDDSSSIVEYNGVVIPQQQLGIPEGKTVKEVLKEAYCKTFGYIDKERDLLIITELGDKALFYEVQQSEDFKYVTSVVALNKIADREKLIVSKGTGKYLIKQCRIRGIQQRALFTGLKRSISLWHDTEEESIPDEKIIEGSLQELTEEDGKKAVQEVEDSLNIEGFN